MFDTRKVANQIKTARKNKNMTQMDLAAYLDHMDEDAMRELILKMAGK